MGQRYYRLVFSFLLFLLLLPGGLRSAVAQQQKNLDVWFERGMTAYEEARYDDAVEAFNWVARRDRKRAEAQYMLALTHLAVGDVKAADKAIVRALRREPENVKYLSLQLQLGFPRDRILALREQKKHDLATKILALDPDNVHANLRLGIEESMEFFDFRKRVTMPDYEAELTDPFDLEAQRTIGNNILDKSKRADKGYPRAIEHYERVLAADPAFRLIYTQLAFLYAAQDDYASIEELAQAMHGYFPQDPYTWLYLGYARYRLGKMEAAWAHFQVARSLMPPAMRAVFEDVTRLMSAEDKARVDQDPSFDPAAFWKRNDPRLLTGYNERWMEHYARLVYSALLYSEPRVDLEGWNSDRGRVYVRYGPPENEYFLSNAVEHCISVLATITNFHIFEYPDVRLAFGNSQPRLNEYPLYSPCSNDGFLLDYTLVAKEVFRREPERFERARGTYPYLVNVFKGPADQADVLVPYGIPVPFNPESDSLRLHTGGFAISDDGLVDEARRALTALDPRQIRAFAEDTFWVDVHHLRVSPGSHEVSIEYEMDPGEIVGFQRSDVEVPDFSSEALQLSDVLLAYGVEEAPGVSTEGLIARNGFVITPAPWGVYRAGQPLYFYFETYNLSRDAGGATRYNVEAVLVEKRDEKGLRDLIQQAFGARERVGVSAEFEETGTSRDEGQYLILDTRDQPVGTYVLAVRVTDDRTSQTAEAQRTVILE